MEKWNPHHNVLWRHHKELLREAEERRLASALRQSRKACRKRKNARTFPGLAATIASALQPSPPDGRTCKRSRHRSQPCGPRHKLRRP
jgi:hypothetical protein